MAIIKNPVCIVKAQEQEDVIDYHDFEWTGSTLSKWKAYKPNFTVPYFATEIGYRAFYSADFPFNMTFENGSQLTSIGNYAFGISGLGNIDLPEGLLSIGKDAFQSYNLSSITIPSTVTAIGDYAFEYSEPLEILVVLATTPPSLGGGALSDTQIDSAVHGYLEPTGNEAIYVPDESVNAYKAATNWAVYESVIKPLSTYLQAEYPDFTWSGRTITEYIGSSADVVIPKIATAIGNSAFSELNKQSLIKTVVIPNSITSIGNEAFSSCDYLETVNIPESVLTIGTDCFLQSSIDNLIIDGNCKITTIPAGFIKRTGIESITLPKTVTSIGDEAFSDGSLTSLTIPIYTPPTLGSDVFLYAPEELIIYVPSNRVNAYKAASGWSAYASKIQAIPSN